MRQRGAPGAGRIAVRATATAGGRRVVVADGSRRAARAGVVPIAAHPTPRGRALAARGARMPLRLTVDYRAPGDPVRRLVLSGLR